MDEYVKKSYDYQEQLMERFNQKLVKVKSEQTYFYNYVKKGNYDDSLFDSDYSFDCSYLCTTISTQFYQTKQFLSN